MVKKYRAGRTHKTEVPIVRRYFVDGVGSFSTKLQMCEAMGFSYNVFVRKKLDVTLKWKGFTIYRLQSKRSPRVIRYMIYKKGVIHTFNGYHSLCRFLDGSLYYIKKKYLYRTEGKLKYKGTMVHLLDNYKDNQEKPKTDD
jgi:hypothetical protein